MTGQPTTYPTSRTWSNQVILNGLTPATTYYYKIVSTNSSVDHFMSPRKPGDTTPYALNTIIDLGVYGQDGYTNKKRDTPPQVQPQLQHTTIGRLATTVNDYEYIIHPGDFAYADDWFLNPLNAPNGTAAYQAILEEFYDELAPISGRKLYMASPGNHEADCNEAPSQVQNCPQGQTNFTDFMHRYDKTMPSAFTSSSRDATAKQNAAKARSLSLPPFWYSFEYGMAHVVMINTETDFANAPDQPGGEAHLDSGPFGYPGQQLDFLRADLASVDRAVTPWVVAAGHRPWYTTTSPGSNSSCAPCQAAFEDIFYQYGVDIGVFGHVHNSQRDYPVYHSQRDPAGMQNPKAPMYIVSGGTGNVEGLDPNGTYTSSTAWAYGDDYSYGQLKFQDPQHMQVNFFRSNDGALLDQSVLYKKHSTRFVRQ